MCETCGVKHASFGTLTGRKKRWCGGCGNSHDGAVSLNKRQRPGLVQVEVEPQSFLAVADVASATAAAAASARSRAKCHRRNDDKQVARSQTQQVGASAYGPEDESADVYPVERVLDVRRRRGLIEYHVKWSGTTMQPGRSRATWGRGGGSSLRTRHRRCERVGLRTIIAPPQTRLLLSAHKRTAPSASSRC